MRPKKFSIEEVFGNIFKAADDSSLAHCVSEDLHMGNGIAVQFKKRYGRIEELKEQNVNVGEVAVLENNGNYIYYLVTKKNYYDKPTYHNVEKTLVNLRERCVNHKIKLLSMPRIACGLDKLDWRRILLIIKKIFKDTKIKIIIYNLPS